MLCYNDRETVEESVRSVLQFAQRNSGEVIVVDNESRDGSWETLEMLSREGVTVLRKRSSRGSARSHAFLNSTGEFVLSHMDCDDIFSPDGLSHILSRYHAGHEREMLMTRKRNQPERSNITVAPRDLIEELGGWRDVNWGEDWDLWNRAARIARYVYMPYPTGSPPHLKIRVRSERETETLTKFMTRFQKFRDSARLGRPVFTRGERVSLGQHIPYWLAKASVAVPFRRLAPAPLPDFDDTVPSL